MSDEFNTTNIDEGVNEIIKYGLMTLTLTSTQIQNKNKDGDNNMTIIYFGECENILREKYNLSNNTTLYIKKIDVIQIGMKIPKIEYEVYAKLNSTKLVKLNLSFCENVNIDLYIPSILTESIDKINASSRYYNDHCYPDDSYKDVDVILKDRQNEFIEKNKTLCQENCIFSEYNNNTKKAVCKCEVQSSTSSSFGDIKIDITKLFKNFKNYKNILNISILFCFKVLFSTEDLIKNIGSYIMIIINLIHYIIMIVFCCKNYYKKIKKKIKEIKFGLIHWNFSKKN